MAAVPITKEAKTLLQRIKKYSSYLWASIISNVLYAACAVATIPLIIPFFQVLFDRPMSQDAPYTVSKWNIPAFLQQEFSIVISELGKEKALSIVCISIVLIFFLKNTFRYLALYFLIPLRNRVVQDLREDLYASYLRMPIINQEEKRKGNYLSILANDVQEVEWSILHMIEVVFKSPLVIIGSLGMMILISPSLTQFVLILLLFTILVIGFLGRRLRRSSASVQTLLGEMVAIVNDSLSGLLVVRGMGFKSFLQGKFRKVNQDYTTQLTRLMSRKDLSSPLSEWMGISVVALLLFYGAHQVLDNQIDPEVFFAFIFAFYQVIEPSKALSTAYFNIQKGRAGYDRIQDVLLSSPISIVNFSVELKAFQNKISLSNVSFGYHKNEDPIILNVDMHIDKGEKVAIVGISGAGKSTLLNLIIGVYPPDSGEVTIDGIPTYNMSDESRGAIFGIVDQDHLMFYGSIKENIIMGRENRNDNMGNILKTSRLDSFVEESSSGIDRLIGDGGQTLSGGQRQRLALARALWGNPPILIFDEATSMLDVENESSIIDHLHRSESNKTWLIVSHNINTIKQCDRILVLDKGRIIEEGNHEELINMRGEYHKLIEMQTFTA